MNTTVKLAIALAAGAAALASPALAQNHQEVSQRTDAECRQDRRTSGTIGGLLGAGAGGAAGRALAASGVRPEGMVLGAVVGAFVGNRLGLEAVYCPPPEYYTQQEGRAYGEVANPYQPQASYVAPQYQQPQVHAQPAYQPPGYQPQPRYSQPVYAQPVYAQSDYTQPPQAPQSHTDWYAPSAASYYGRERSGVIAPAQAIPPAPYAVPRAGYAPIQTLPCCGAVSQSYSYGPVYQPAPDAMPRYAASYAAPPPPAEPSGGQTITIVAPPRPTTAGDITIVAPPQRGE
jgi:hypothetical protein